MNKKLLLTSLIMVVFCVLLITLGIRHENTSVPAGGDGGDKTQQTQQTQQESTGIPDPITATLAVCGDVMSHSPQTNDAYDAATKAMEELTVARQNAQDKPE